MFNGMRHYIASPGVYEALFSDVSLQEVPEISSIMRGPDLVEGTVLIRGGDGRIFLVTAVSPGEARRFLIADWDTFQAFGFDMDRVKDAPDILISAVVSAPPILIAARATDRPESEQ